MDFLKEMIGCTGIKLLREAATYRELFECFMHKVWGGGTFEAWLEKAQAVEHVQNIARPCLVLTAKDDPLHGVDKIGIAAGMAKGSPNLAVLVTECGGHVSWPVALTSGADGYQFMVDLSFRFMQAVRAI